MSPPPDRGKPTYPSSDPTHASAALGSQPANHMGEPLISLQNHPPEVIADIALCLTHQANYLLDRQITRLENDFVTKGGLKEQMFKARMTHRRSQ